jgi:uncharacterized membrane protein YphA (DoxX/SURF4 family)
MLGCTLVIQGSAYFSSSHAGLDSWVLAMLAIICAAFLLLGLFTPIVSLLAGVGVVGIALSWFVVPDRNLFAEHLMAINAVVLSLAMFLLGPGAFSLDARIFGRREIIIPHSSNSIQS